MNSSVVRQRIHQQNLERDMKERKKGHGPRQTFFLDELPITRQENPEASLQEVYLITEKKWKQWKKEQLELALEQ